MMGHNCPASKGLKCDNIEQLIMLMKISIDIKKKATAIDITFCVKFMFCTYPMVHCDNSKCMCSVKRAV